MAKKTGKSVSPTGQSDDVTQLLSDGKFLIANVDDVRERRLRELTNTVFHLASATQEEKMAKVARALELYEDLKPADGLESMLAIQMVGTHNAITECMQRAAAPNRTAEGRDMALKQVIKLMAIFVTQIAGLDKHRGKGPQKVTVEYVNVAAGGQAIVGNVQTGTRTTPLFGETGTIDCPAEVPCDAGTKKAPRPRRKPNGE